MLFDAHCHIDDERYDEAGRDELAVKIENSDVKYVVDTGTNPDDCLLAVHDAEKYPFCFAAVGIYPHECGAATDETLDFIADLANHDRVRAIGEIGLDYHYDDVDPETQKIWFAKQIRLANRLRMPIVIHSREACKDTLDILKENGAFSAERQSFFPKRPDGSGGLVPDSRVLMHCYSYSADVAKEYVRLGGTISVGGSLTFKKNKKTPAVVEAVPLAFLTTETDAPYLAPEPLRGRENISPYMKYVAEKIAEIKGVSYEEVCDTTFANACRFYGVE
ncbi:MAG: TatD family hydrolase [Eubacteriales bacterium]|nr:TatD family hydrolase [Eubacteriales bacterium]